MHKTHINRFWESSFYVYDKLHLLKSISSAKLITGMFHQDAVRVTGKHTYSERFHTLNLEQPQPC